MQTKLASLHRLLLAGSAVLALGTSAFAADVTPDRLVNADKEPGNWLMNHRTYDAQRFSPLDKISKATVKAQARLCRGDRRHVGEREPAIDAARRGWLPLRGRPVGRALQDRWAFR
jgi:hypothetical protein